MLLNQHIKDIFSLIFSSEFVSLEVVEVVVEGGGGMRQLPRQRRC